MKKILLACMVTALCLISCNEEPQFEQIAVPPSVSAPTNITRSSATLSAVYGATLSYNRSQIEDRGFLVSTTSTFDVAQRFEATSTSYDTYEEDGISYSSFSATATGLEDNTTYYYCGYVSKGVDMIKGEVATFTTLPAPEDKTITLHLNAATNITANTADMNGTITIGKDAVGTITECGFICSTEAQPSFDGIYRVWKFDAAHNSDFNTWKGTKSLTGTINKLSPITKYYYRMYYKIGETCYYDTNIKSLTTTQSPTYTVAQVMNIYNGLNLADGSMSSETYTVRGYVTKWISGYPDYQDADFWIDDNTSGSTSLLKCFRLVGVNSSDKRTLTVGDYIEAQNCRLMKYNGIAELVSGTFTVLKAAPTPLDEILGTYTMSAKMGNYVDYETIQDVTWYGIRIMPNGGNDVKIEGLYQGNSNYVAFGTYNSSTKKLTLRKTTTETLPTFSYYYSYDSRYYTVGAYFRPIEWAYCGDCGVWSGSTIPYSSAESGDFNLTSAGRLEQGKSTVYTSSTWYFSFYYYSSEKGNLILGSTSDIHDVVLTRTSTDY